MTVWLVCVALIFVETRFVLCNLIRRYFDRQTAAVAATAAAVAAAAFVILIIHFERTQRSVSAIDRSFL